MKILDKARLAGLDPGVRDSRGRTARQYIEERPDQSAPDAVKNAFAKLLDTISARSGSHDDDPPFPEVFYDAIDRVQNYARTPWGNAMCCRL